MRASTLLFGAAALVELTSAVPNAGPLHKKWWWLTTDKNPFSEYDKDKTTTYSLSTSFANITETTKAYTGDKDHPTPRFSITTAIETSSISDKDKISVPSITSAPGHDEVSEKDKDKNKSIFIYPTGSYHNDKDTDKTQSTIVYPTSSYHNEKVFSTSAGLEGKTSSGKTASRPLGTGSPSTFAITTTNLLTLTYSLLAPPTTGTLNVTKASSTGSCTITYTVTIIPVPASPPAIGPTEPTLTAPSISSPTTDHNGSDIARSSSGPVQSSLSVILPSNTAPITTYGTSCDKDKGCKTVTVIIPPFSSIVGGGNSATPSVQTPHASTIPVVTCDKDNGCSTITITVPSINTLTLASVASPGSPAGTPSSEANSQPTIPVVTCDKTKGCTTVTVNLEVPISISSSASNGGQSSSFSSKPEVLGSTSFSYESYTGPSESGPSVSKVTTFSGYQVVSSPPESIATPFTTIFKNGSALVTPVWTAPMLGNAYGGGLVTPPSVYVTPIASASAPAAGVPPGYGITYSAGAASPPIPEIPITPASLPKTYVETTVVTTITSSETTYIITSKYPASLPISSGISLATGPEIPSSRDVGTESEAKIGSSPSIPVYLVGVTPIPGTSGGALEGIYSSATPLPNPSKGASEESFAASAPNAAESGSRPGPLSVTGGPAEAASPGSSSSATVATVENGSPLGLLSSLLGATAKPTLGPSTPTTSAVSSYVVGVISSPAGGSPVTYTIPPYSSGAAPVALAPVKGSSGLILGSAGETSSAGSATIQSFYNALTSALATTAAGAGISTKTPVAATVALESLYNALNSALAVTPEGGETLTTLIETNTLGASITVAIPVGGTAPIPSGASGLPGSGKGISSNGTVTLPLGPTAVPIYEGNATAVTVSVSLWLVILAVAVIFL